MKVQKYEISRTIDKLKSIVQKNDQFPALGGVLVKDGYLIASNTEMTMQLKLEASKGSCFIIPMKAFDVIKNLPDGEVIIDADGKNIVTIKTKAIKNKYQSYPPEEFSFDITEDLDAPEVVINGKRMMDAIGHVIYAAADSSSATQMMGVYFEGGENKIKLVALDGHRQDIYSSASYGLLIKKEYYVEITDRPLSWKKDIDLLTEYDSVRKEFLRRCGK